MRILTYTSLFPNSQQPNHGIFVYQRVAHLARRPGNEVAVIAPVPYFPKWAPGESRRVFSRIARHEWMGELTVEHPRYPLVPKVSMLFHAVLMALGSLPTARRLHARYAFDCIDAHFVYPDGTAALLLGKWLGVPVVVTARGTDVTQYSAFKLIRPMLRWTYREAAGIVTVSESLKRAIVEFGISGERVRPITNGIDAERFKPIDPIVARRRLGLADGDSVVVSVGNLNAVKSQELLVSAMALLAPRHPTLRLYLIGDGPRRRSLQEQIDCKKLQGRVILVGGVSNEDLGTWFSAADVSSLVSSREGWPNVVTESIACGTPVVAARVGGISEIIRSPEMGLFVDRAPECIAEGIETALQRPWQRKEISEQIRKRTWSRVAEETENYFRECVAEVRALQHPKRESDWKNSSKN